MPKTLKDFELEKPKWLVDNWLPIGHRIMDVAPEGSGKTKVGLWMCICIAAGMPIWGRHTIGGPVLIIDEETPKDTLEDNIDRFCMGLKLRRRDIPLEVWSMTGFKLNRKTHLDYLIKYIEKKDPVLVRMDSLTALCPSGRQGLSLLDPDLGSVIRDELSLALSKSKSGCSILLSAHTKKEVGVMPIDEIKNNPIQNLVFGYSSIVGQGCDTGLFIKKMSEFPGPTRFAVFTFVRRQAIPLSDTLYLEIEEEKYGDGWSRIREIPPSNLPPVNATRELFSLFSFGGVLSEISQKKIRQECALMTTKDCLYGLNELLKMKVIVPGFNPMSYTLNTKFQTEVDPEYLKQLTRKSP